MWNHKFILLCLILFGAGVVTAPIELLFPVYVEDAFRRECMVYGEAKRQYPYYWAVCLPSSVVC